MFLFFSTQSSPQSLIDFLVRVILVKRSGKINEQKKNCDTYVTLKSLTIISLGVYRRDANYIVSGAQTDSFKWWIRLFF